MDGVFTVKCTKSVRDEVAACDWVRQQAKAWFGKEPEVRAVSMMFPTAAPDDESYELVCDEKGVTITAPHLAGVRYAMYTLRQAAVPKRGTATAEGYIAPKLRVVDRPALGFRGTFTMIFKQYEAVPKNIAQEVIEKRIKEGKVRASAE